MSMIPLPEPSGAAAAPGPRSAVAVGRAASLVATTVAAIACGVVLAWAIDRNFGPTPPPAVTEVPKLPALNPEFTDRVLHVAMKPMVANLAQPPGVWIRLEGGFVTTGLDALAAERMAADVQQAMLGHLRSTTLAQIEGASGLLHLREDLNDIAKVQSGGHVTRFILETMVVQ